MALPQGQNARCCPSRFGLFLCLGWLSSAILFSGCSRGDGIERVVVSGTVKYQGKPIDHGTIQFTPDINTQAHVSSSPIDAGSYRVDRNGGVAVGTYKIVIEAVHANVPPDAQGTFKLSFAPPNYLPAKYNEKSELKITIPSGSPSITKDFDLTD